MAEGTEESRTVDLDGAARTVIGRYHLLEMKADCRNDVHAGGGALIGTPDYLSPEQASSAGEDIGTRTDVYSPGII
jgi:hypothetical protein